MSETDKSPLNHPQQVSNPYPKPQPSNSQEETSTSNIAAATTATTTASRPPTRISRTEKFDVNVTSVPKPEDALLNKDYNKNYNNLLKLKQEMLETKQAKAPWRPFRCDSLIAKQSSERKLLVFVIFLFVVIIVGLIIIYYFHEEELYYVYKGPNIIVNEKTLDLSINNALGEQVLTGTLWKSRPKDRLPYDCSEAESLSGDLCLLWKKALKLRILNLPNHSENETRCYEITRTSLDPEVDQKDCFNLGDAQWFGGGLMNVKEWPLEKVSMDKKLFITGSPVQRNVFGPVLEKYWLNSKGVAIIVNDNSSLHISINGKMSEMDNTTDGQFCLYVDAFDSENSLTKHFSDLKYTICVAPDIKSVHKVALPIVLGSSLKPTQNSTLPLFNGHYISTGSFLKRSYDQNKLINFASHFQNKPYNGHTLLIDDGWEYHYGDLIFDSSKFQNPKELIDTIHSMNLKLSLIVHSQINTDSQSFHYSTQNGLLVKDASGNVPGLTRWSTEAQINKTSAGVAGVLDLSNKAMSWQTLRLRDFQKQHKIDYFHFAGGELSSLPARPSFVEPLSEPNEYSKRYAKLAARFGSFVPVESAYKAQNEPILVRMTKLKSTWSSLDGLQSVIPSAVNLGLSGYRLFLPEASGGSSFSTLPSKELFIRWNQLNTFLPFMHLSIPPDHFGEDVYEQYIGLMELRDKLVVPAITKAFEDTDISEPIIKPIWWNAPGDILALRCKDEFLVGEKLLVAPILEEGKFYRDVYLPLGLWEDKMTDEVHVGPKIIKNVPVPIDKIVYYIKK